jgi:hypothetical protein
MGRPPVDADHDTLTLVVAAGVANTLLGATGSAGVVKATGVDRYETFADLSCAATET